MRALSGVDTVASFRFGFECVVIGYQSRGRGPPVFAVSVGTDRDCPIRPMARYSHKCTSDAQQTVRSTFLATSRQHRDGPDIRPTVQSAACPGGSPRIDASRATILASIRRDRDDGGLGSPVVRSPHQPSPSRTTRSDRLIRAQFGQLRAVFADPGGHDSHEKIDPPDGKRAYEAIPASVVTTTAPALGRSRRSKSVIHLIFDRNVDHTAISVSHYIT